jgi:UDP-N-acetylglucosamine 2-epimerase (non-hydrolysing)
MRVLSVFGTRPEAIKMAPLVLQLASDARIESRVCVTGQHRQMLDAVLDLFGIEPDHDLSVMSPGQDLFDVTSRVLLGMRDVLRAEKPDLVLVHGDTTSCLATSLAAFYERVPVGHVEAGLRSHDLSLPFPEEMNRRVADLVSDVYFAPTECSRHNLITEGVAASRIHVTGNTGIDALLWMRARVAVKTARHFASAFGPLLTPLVDHWPGPIVLVTGHRRESFGRGFSDLCRAIRATALAHKDWLFVYPVHPNPNVQGPVSAALGGISNVLLVDPIDYAPFVYLMDRSSVILTDSGGLQEEGPALGKPVLVTRDVTERPEALAAGTVRLVGTDPRRIQSALEELFGEESARSAMSSATNPYGDGRASGRIVEAVCARYARAELAAGAA